jgi:protein ImuB
MAKRYVSIWFPELHCDAHIAKHLKDAGEALLIVHKVRGRSMVKEANTIAKAKGLTAGMNLADCRAIFPQVKAIEEQSKEIAALLQQFAVNCIQYTPLVAIDDADSLILDASGCAHLWGGEQAYLEHIQDKFLHIGYQCKLGMADTMAMAWAAAHYGCTPHIVAPGMQQQAIAGLPPAALQLPADITDKLHKLGLHRIQDFMHLKPLTLRKRFGAALLLKLQQCLGTALEFMQAIQPPPCYEQRLPCLDPILTAGGIQIALTTLINNLCSQLENEGKGLRSAVFTIYRIDHTQQSIQIGTQQPNRHPKHLFKLFELKLTELAPEPGIEAFVLSAAIVEDCALSTAALWMHPKEDKNAIANLLDRIAGKIGAHKINRQLPVASHWPERSSKTVNNIEVQKECNWPSQKYRPILLLPKAEPIEVMVPLPDYPPLQFKHRGLIHRITKADGPERIEPEWWISPGLHRDYYCVEDEQGARYWIYRLGHYDGDNPQWFVHGLFA